MLQALEPVLASSDRIRGVLQKAVPILQLKPHRELILDQYMRALREYSPRTLVSLLTVSPYRKLQRKREVLNKTKKDVSYEAFFLFQRHTLQRMEIQKV